MHYSNFLDKFLGSKHFIANERFLRFQKWAKEESEVVIDNSRVSTLKTVFYKRDLFKLSRWPAIFQHWESTVLSMHKEQGVQHFHKEMRVVVKFRSGDKENSSKHFLKIYFIFIVIYLINKKFWYLTWVILLD